LRLAVYSNNSHDVDADNDADKKKRSVSDHADLSFSPGPSSGRLKIRAHMMMMPTNPPSKNMTNRYTVVTIPSLKTVVRGSR
jgi:hypothetical protein